MNSISRADVIKQYDKWLEWYENKYIKPIDAKNNIAQLYESAPFWILWDDSYEIDIHEEARRMREYRTLLSKELKFTDFL